MSAGYKTVFKMRKCPFWPETTQHYSVSQQKHRLQFLHEGLEIESDSSTHLVPRLTPWNQCLLVWG